MHKEHPSTEYAAGTLPLDSPEIAKVLKTFADPAAFVVQVTPRELAGYGFVGEPLTDAPIDVVVFHGDWSGNEVNLHGGVGAHVRWVFIDARTGNTFGGGSADCTDA